MLIKWLAGKIQKMGAGLEKEADDLKQKLPPEMAEEHKKMMGPPTAYLDFIRGLAGKSGRPSPP